VATKTERAAVYTEGDALNAIAKGYAAIRSSTVLVTDAKGTTLSLSVTNASKAVPAGVKTFSFWSDVDFYFRFNTPATTADGAFIKANDIVECIIDVADTSVPTAIHAILASATGTLWINWGFGH
jgi:hypothetical protein